MELAKLERPGTMLLDSPEPVTLLQFRYGTSIYTQAVPLPLGRMVRFGLNITITLFCLKPCNHEPKMKPVVLMNIFPSIKVAFPS